MAQASKKVQELAKKVEALPYPGKILTRIAVARANNDDAALEAAFAEGKEFLDANGLLPENDITAKIQQLDKRMWTRKDRLKTLKADAQEILEGHTGYKKVQEAQAALDRARQELGASLSSDGDYNDLMENIADETNELKDDQYTLSVYLVEYYAQTHAHQVEVGDKGDAREVIVTGRLGKKSKFQTNLFGANHEK